MMRKEQKMPLKETLGRIRKNAGWLPVAVAALLLNAGCFLGISAYFTSTDIANNTFTVAENTIKITEDFPSGIIPSSPNDEYLPDENDPDAPVEMPSDEISLRKKVNVENTGPTPVAVRVNVTFSTADMKKVSELDINTEDWEEREDGYYYYKQVLDVGASTNPLFNKVIFSSDATSAQLKDFSIYVYSESRDAQLDTEYMDVVW